MYKPTFNKENNYGGYLPQGINNEISRLVIGSSYRSRNFW